MTASYKKLLSLEIGPTLVNSQYIGLFTTYPTETTPTKSTIKEADYETSY
jgi:hypothetical protein